LHIKQAVTKSPIPSTLLFIGIYIVVAALSLPGASFVTVIGGFIFPQPLSTLYVVTGATVGASLLFLACKTAFKKPIERYLKRHAKGKLSELQKGFKQSASSYMLFVRFVPLFPFWLVNLAAAFLGASFKAFVWTTFIGVIPGSFVYTQLGKGLSVSFSQNKLSLASAFNFDMTIAIVLLALFSLLPIAIRHFRKKKQR
jgi:uncharacterized membrane protein YdjX (TVP38/TMEM64 family)